MNQHEKPTDRVSLERKQTTIPSYVPYPPDKNPIFYEKRAYQGAHGRIYPLPVTDRLSHEKVDRQYDSVTLENEYIKIMVLPEIGGRIHIGQDKTNGYNFIYHNTVIKPALIGIAGSWISGGIEFNWPQHHRPTTFRPVQAAVEENPDGGKTAWVGETEPLYGLRALAGVTVEPGRSYLKVKVRATNPTPFPQPFMWWANLGVHCDENYRIVFPPDIKHLAFHDRAFISDWPMVQNRTTDVPNDVFDGSWFKNHVNAGSFMVMDGSSAYDFIEGYDMARGAGTVHVADRHVSPGKKLFTWGNADFAQAWRGNLTDRDGYYLELMTGVYTDNQPDFSWMQPGETRIFEHIWYPVRDIGLVSNATSDAAVSLELAPGRISIGYCATGRFENAVVTVTAGDRLVYERRIDIDPAHPFMDSTNFPEGASDTQIETALRTSEGRLLVSYRPGKLDRAEASVPQARTPSPEPAEIATPDELYIHGLHIEQYRHHCLEASDYYGEALRRDPGDIRCNNAMGLLEMRKGCFESAERYFRQVLERLKSRNTNPYDGEPEFNLGLALRFQRKHDEAYEHFYKATWNCAWKSQSFQMLAEIDSIRGDFETALMHVDDALRTNSENTAGLDLKAAILRRLGRPDEALAVARHALTFDILDLRAQFEVLLAGGCSDGAHAALAAGVAGKAEDYIGVAIGYDSAGMIDEARAVLETYIEQCYEYPMVYYFMAGLCHERGDNEEALAWEQKAEAACPDYCFPNRIEYIVMLRFAMAVNPSGAMAPYYLGNLFYDKQRYEDAIACWERSRELNGSFSIVHRNLAMAYFDKRGQHGRAIESMRRAFEANGSDSRLLYELLQGMKNANAATVEERLKLLEGKDALVAERNDCYVEMLILLLQAGRLDEAAKKILGHVFDIYEGGEGKLVRVYEWIAILRGLKLLDSGDAAGALACIRGALTLPESFHEGRNVLSGVNHVHYWAGVAAEAAGDTRAAKEHFEAATAYVARPGETAYYRALALRRLGEADRADEALRTLLAEGVALVAKGGRYDFFATGVPTPPPFEGDREKHNVSEGMYCKALAHIGLGRADDGSWELEQVLARSASHLGAWLHAGRTGVHVLR